MRSLPSMKASVMATRGITMAATVGIGTGFEIGQFPLSSSVQEDKLLYSSASNMMAVKQNTKNTNAKNTMKVAAPALLSVVAVSMKSLKLLGTLHSEDS